MLQYLTYDAVQYKGSPRFDYWNLLRRGWGSIIFWSGSKILSNFWPKGKKKLRYNKKKNCTFYDFFMFLGLRNQIQMYLHLTYDAVQYKESPRFDYWNLLRRGWGSIIFWSGSKILRNFWPKGKKKLRYNKKKKLYLLWFFYVFGVILHRFYSCAFFDLRLSFFAIGP